MSNKLSVFEVAQTSWEVVTQNKAWLLGLMALYMIPSFIIQFLLETGAMIASVPLMVLSVVAMYIVSFVTGLILIINMYYMVTGKGTVGIGVLSDYPVMNYVRFLGAMILMIVGFVMLGGAGAAIGFALIASEVLPVAVLAVLAIAAYVGLMYVMLMFVYVAMEVLVGNNGVFDSFKSSMELTRNVKIKLILGYLLAILVTFSVLLGLAVVGMVLFFIVDLVSNGSEALFVAVGVLTAIAGAVIYFALIAWTMIGYVVSYVRLKGQDTIAVSDEVHTDHADEDNDEEVIEVEMVEEGNTEGK